MHTHKYGFKENRRDCKTTMVHIVANYNEGLMELRIYINTLEIVYNSRYSEGNTFLNNRCEFNNSQIKLELM